LAVCAYGVENEEMYRRGGETERESSNIDGKREEKGESMPSMEM